MADTRNWPDLAIGLYDKLTGRNAEITYEFDKFYLVNVYTPNSGQVLQRLKYRVNEWDVFF